MRTLFLTGSIGTATPFEIALCLMIVACFMALVGVVIWMIVKP